MRNIKPVLAACLLAFASHAMAQSPERSIRPEPRLATAALTSLSAAPVKVSYRADERPKPRFATAAATNAPSGLIFRRIEPGDPETTLASTPPVYRSPRPEMRPSGLFRRSAAKTGSAAPVRVATSTPNFSARPGTICGDPRIRGEALPPIKGRISGCGVENPVRVTSIDGIALSQQSIMDCATARTLRVWASDSLKPTIGRRGGGVQSLKIAAHYSCRTRNSQPGAKISEHGKGHAIDIAAIELNNGDSISILNGWKDRRDRKVLAALHSSACRRFGTVLGPNADRYHRDHFHFDTARYRNGSYCR